MLPLKFYLRKNQFDLHLDETVSISERGTSGQTERCRDGSFPSEAHGGGWEDLGEDGWEPPLKQIKTSLLTATEIEILQGELDKVLLILFIIWFRNDRRTPA